MRACTCVRDWGPTVLGENPSLMDVVKPFCCLGQASVSSSAETGTEAPERLQCHSEKLPVRTCLPARQRGEQSEDSEPQPQASCHLSCAPRWEENPSTSGSLDAVGHVL